MNKQIFIKALVVGFGFTALAAIAQPLPPPAATQARPDPSMRRPMPSPEQMAEMRVNRLAEAVKATPEQKAQLQAIAKKSQADMLAVLTPEQREMLKSKMKAFGERRRRDN
jgi:Spy/CpxP family protein refolding chaperone